MLATRATSFDYTVETTLHFQPKHYSQTAGTGLYYDSNNWIYANVTYDEPQQIPVLTLLQAQLGKRKEFHSIRIPVGNRPVSVRFHYNHGSVQFFYRFEEGTIWTALSEVLDVRYLSDEGVNGEPGEIGGFTALFNFIASVDSYQQHSVAVFEQYSVTHQEASNKG